MTDVEVEDSLTKLNTQLNTSMVLMDTTFEMKTPHFRSNKSIRINTKTQTASPQVSPMSRKSILKRSEKKSMPQEEQIIRDNETSYKAYNSKMLVDTTQISRPCNVEDLVRKEGLSLETTESTFNLEDLSDSEEIWIMDIPRTIDPRQLKGQMLSFGEKSKFKINEERYCAVSHTVKSNITCVLKTGKEKSQYKTVNLKPAGAITVRRKLSSVSKTKPIKIENCSVPFPENLKVRHPLFGINYKDKVIKEQ